ncbi:protein BatD [Alteromonas sp. a30]|nr:protein BatD [Alteromonas sp. a30]
MRCFLIFSLMLISASVLADVTDVTATVDKNPIMRDESFILEVTANDEVAAGKFDPSPLLKDFVVGRTSTSRQTQVINFDTTRTTRWQTVLIPREIGRFTIPSFNIEGVSTQPFTVEVLPVSQNKNAQGRDIFITTEISKDEVYLQQQVKYTAKLHVAVDLQRGSLTAPQIADAEIEQVGQDKEYSEIVGGRRYRIIERTFSIIPQKSGTFNVQAPYFEGEMLDNSRRSFGFFNRTRTINRVGENRFLTVKPIPDNYDHHWLPSEHVEIHDEWQGDINNLTVGDPITRTLTLTAIGVVEEQLPEIVSQYPDSVKTYPDQADSTTVERNGTFVAQRKESIAIIPNTDGLVTLPEIKVPWFNTRTGKTEYATIPAKQVNIKAAEGTQETVSTPETNIQPQAPEFSPRSQATSPNSAIPTVLSNPPLPYWSLSSWVLLVLWLLTLLAWFISSRRKTLSVDTVKRHTATHQNEQEAWKKLVNAAKTNDSKNLTNYLQQWLAVLCENPQQSLAASVSQLKDEHLKQQVTQYFDNRFGANNATDSLSTLMESLKKIRKQYQEKPKVKGTELSPLYPNTL